MDTSVPALGMAIAALFAGPVMLWASDGSTRLRAGLDGLVLTLVSGTCLLHLGPHALEHGGGIALVGIITGLALPALAHLDRGAWWVSTALALLGLHALVDGAALGMLDTSLTAGVGAAVVAHRLPVGLAISLEAHSAARAGLVLLGLAGLTAIGFGVGAGLGSWLPSAAHTLTEGLIVGGLLHVVVAHRIPLEVRSAVGPSPELQLVSAGAHEEGSHGGPGQRAPHAHDSHAPEGHSHTPEDPARGDPAHGDPAHGGDARGGHAHDRHSHAHGEHSHDGRVHGGCSHVHDGRVHGGCSHVHDGRVHGGCSRAPEGHAHSHHGHAHGGHDHTHVGCSHGGTPAHDHVGTPERRASAVGALIALAGLAALAGIGGATPALAHLGATARAFASLSLISAPALLAGFVLAGLVSALLDPARVGWLAGGGTGGRALWGWRSGSRCRCAPVEWCRCTSR